MTRKIYFIATISVILCSLADCVPIAALNKHSVDWRHLVEKRSAGDKVKHATLQQTKSKQTQKTKEQGVNVFETNDRNWANRKNDDDIDEENEKTIDWQLLDGGDSNALNREMALRRRRRNVVQTPNANRQRSRTTKTNSNNKMYHTSTTGRQRQKQQSRYRAKRALFEDDSSETRQISDSDLEKLAYLISELHQLNEADNDDGVVNAPLDEDYYFPQQPSYSYQVLTPNQLSDEDLALLANWWKSEQQRLDESQYRPMRKRSFYYPQRYSEDTDRYDSFSDPVEVVLLNPEDEDEEDETNEWSDEYYPAGGRGDYVSYPVEVSPETLEDVPLSSYYAYDADDFDHRRSDEIELEKRISSLARYLNLRMKKR